MRVEYSSNNSGGSWWLKDEDWKALEAAGWEVDWFANQEQKFCKPDENGRWLGALATSATRRGLSLRDAAEEWERITGESATDAGCACCGQPHSFTEYDDNDKYVTSGPNTSYSAGW
jgi:hypothetical protein